MLPINSEVPYLRALARSSKSSTPVDMVLLPEGPIWESILNSSSTWVTKSSTLKQNAF